MSISQAAGVVGPFAGLDVPWLLRMRAETRRHHPFLIWAPFDAPARIWTYGEFHERVGALAAGLKARGVKPGEFVLIHLDNCIEAVLAWFACAELGAIAVTTNTRSAPAERVLVVTAMAPSSAQANQARTASMQLSRWISTNSPGLTPRALSPAASAPTRS